MGKGKRSSLGRGSNPSKGTEMLGRHRNAGSNEWVGVLGPWAPANRKQAENEARRKQVPDGEELRMLFQSLNLALGASGSHMWLCRFLSPIHDQSDSVRVGEWLKSLFSTRSAGNTQPWLGPTAMKIARRTFSNRKSLPLLDSEQAQDWNEVTKAPRK